MTHLDINDVVFLQRGEHMIKDTVLGPAVGAGVNRVPIAEFFR